MALLAGCSAPRTPTPPAQLPPLDDILTACAVEVSCMQNPLTTTISTCANVVINSIANHDPEIAREVQCAASSSDCATILACATRNHDPAYCAAHPGSSCDGDLLVHCGTGAPDWALFPTDCAALGMQCAQPNGTASCTDGVTCTGNVNACDGNRVVACNGGLQFREDCALSGIPNATCRTQYSPPEPFCLPSGAFCSSDRCDGDVAVRCRAGEEDRLDCAQEASHCVVDYMLGAHCNLIASECTSDQCAGDSIAVCVEGALHPIACGRIGLSTCVLDGSGEPHCR